MQSVTSLQVQQPISSQAAKRSAAALSSSSSLPAMGRGRKRKCAEDALANVKELDCTGNNALHRQARFAGLLLEKRAEFAFVTMPWWFMWSLSRGRRVSL